MDMLCSYGKNIIPVTEISPVNKRDLGNTRKSFVSYERSVTFHIIFITGEISLVNLSKCFLANRDNFSSYEQALSCFKNEINTFSHCFLGNLAKNRIYILHSGVVECNMAVIVTF